MNIKLREDFQGVINYQVMTMEGREVFNGNINSQTSDGQFRITTGNLDPGIYLLRIRKDQEVSVMKFVKK